jgi:hypothetical protein
MYQKVEALNAKQNAQLRFQEPVNFSFAAALQTVPLVLSEFAEVQKSFPIVFTATEKEGRIPVALLGLQARENLFIDASGKWQTPYIPAFVRRYPFAVSEPEPGKLMVLFDPTYPGFSEETGEPLFAEGKESETLKRKIDYVSRFHQDAIAARKFITKIEEFDLFSDMSVKLQVPGVKDGVQLSGFSVIDDTKLKALSSKKLSELMKEGLLLPIFAHQLSLSSMARLIEASVKRRSVTH